MDERKIDSICSSAEKKYLFVDGKLSIATNNACALSPDSSDDLMLASKPYDELNVYIDSSFLKQQENNNKINIVFIFLYTSNFNSNNFALKQLNIYTESNFDYLINFYELHLGDESININDSNLNNPPIAFNIKVALNQSIKMRYFRAFDNLNLTINNKIHFLQQCTSYLEYCVLSLKCKNLNMDLNIDLLGANSICKIFGAYIANENTIFNANIAINHVVPNTTSLEIYNGIAHSGAVTKLRGATYIQEGASKSKAHQANKGLLVSENASLDIQPELEILVDDVQCSHAANVGSISQSDIFYLNSRGIDIQTASKILQEAFVVSTYKDVAPDIMEILCLLFSKEFPLLVL